MDESGPLWDLLKPHVFKLKRSGSSNAVGFCPFHDDKRTPSFAINIRTGMWLCFSCGLKGNLRRLLELFGKGISEIDSIVEPYEESMTKQRDIDNIRWRLRFRTDPFLGECILPEALLGIFYYMPVDLIESGFSPELIHDFDIGYDKNKSRIIFPIRDIYGNLLGVSGRTTIDDHPRYKVYSGGYNNRHQGAGDFGEEFDTTFYDYQIKSKNHLWNGHNVIPNLQKEDNKKPLIVVEGFKACLWLVQHGYPNTIALMGSRVSRNQADLIGRLSNPVVLFLDNDEAGQKATTRVFKELSRTNNKVFAASYPKRADDTFQPDDLIEQEVQQAISEAKRWRRWASINLNRSAESL